MNHEVSAAGFRSQFDRRRAIASGEVAPLAGRPCHLPSRAENRPQSVALLRAASPMPPFDDGHGRVCHNRPTWSWSPIP